MYIWVCDAPLALSKLFGLSFRTAEFAPEILTET
jgi:hypothetical protein